MPIDILVRGRNVTVEEAVGAAARQKVAKLERLAHDIRRIEVEFSEVRNPRVADSQVCNVTIHLKRRALKAHAAAPEPAAALDLVVDKAEHQLHRLKDKRVEH
ncbi:MAG: ribosome-associated translation inhibitor RaiA [Actinobacteria bacterium]|nr:ribosome-associated translation inhibitor RaiA [Actinomycetota bacterium]